MIWSLFRIFLFIAAIGAISFGAALIVDSGSIIRLEAADLEFSASPVAVAIGAVLLIPLFWILFFLFGLARAGGAFLAGDETALSRYLNRNRQQRGFEALAAGLTAMASGEPRLALTKALKAERDLKQPGLTGILIAQAAERSGDRERASVAYRNLLDDKNTRFAGLAGLLKQKLEEGRTDVALKIAERALALNPGHEDLQDTLLRLQSKEQDWAGAGQTLSTKLRSKSIPRDVYTRRNAVALFAEARQLIESGETGKGEKAALDANRASPGLVPAAVLAAEIRERAGARKAAVRILRKAWEVGPHPDLAMAFAAFEPDETPDARRTRFSQLVGKGYDAAESRMVMAELAIACEDFPDARRALGDLASLAPTSRSLMIMAAIERGEGSDEETVRGWLVKAVTASRGTRWVCGNCNRLHAEWSPVCPGCEGFDTLEWREAQSVPELHADPAGLLPLGRAAPISDEGGDGPDEQSS